MHSEFRGQWVKSVATRNGQGKMETEEGEGGRD